MCPPIGRPPLLRGWHRLEGGLPTSDRTTAQDTVYKRYVFIHSRTDLAKSCILSDACSVTDDFVVRAAFRLVAA